MVTLADPATTARRARLTGFEDEFQALRRQTKRPWVIGAAVFLVCFMLSAWLGDFFKVTQLTMPDGSREWRWILPAGIPRLGEFIERTIPVLRWDSLSADFAEWFWRWKVWLNLLIETILIAFMGTVFGVVGGEAVLQVANTTVAELDNNINFI